MTIHRTLAASNRGYRMVHRTSTASGHLRPLAHAPCLTTLQLGSTSRVWSHNYPTHSNRGHPKSTKLDNMPDCLQSRAFITTQSMREVHHAGSHLSIFQNLPMLTYRAIASYLIMITKF
ncbi:hypothetical protein ElyMa_005106300 [Elysia marginata]|uniref:Uncharacterized protein n=1 Tax=Elysia marginata TaxID=1093978 RepID=A0AAV4JKV0_9GAST|nr:hypothetical protein ElyMa_005106300 [Elysia marginata]